MVAATKGSPVQTPISSSTSWVIPLSGVVAGDVCLVMTQTYGDHTISGYPVGAQTSGFKSGKGFFEFDDSGDPYTRDNDGDFHTEFFFYTVPSTVPSSVTVTMASAVAGNAIVYPMSGVSTTAALNAYTMQNHGSSEAPPIVAPSATSTVDGCLMLRYGQWVTNTEAMVAPSGATGVIATPTGTASPCGILYSTGIKSPAGASGTSSMADPNWWWGLGGTIMVAPAPAGGNAAPIANAGADQSGVSAGSTVTLTGSGTDSDGTIASHTWTQTAGPTVVLSGSGTAPRTFTAPSVTGGTSLTFSLVVTDNLGLSSTADTVVIAVNAPGSSTITDSFTGANGAAWSNIWALGYDGVGGNVTIQSNKGRMQSIGGSGYDATRQIARHLTTQPVNFDVTFTWQIVERGSVEQYETVYYRANGDYQDTNNAYQVDLNDSDDGTIGLFRSDAGSQTVLGTLTVPLVAATDYKMRIKAIGASHKVKVWLASSAEPTTGGPDNDGFQIKATDSTYLGAGYFGFQVFPGGSDATRTMLLDDFNMTIPSSGAAPTVNAGVDQTVDPNLVDSITLTASATDSDGTIASYLWEDVTGSAVTIAGSGASRTVPIPRSKRAFSETARNQVYNPVPVDAVSWTSSGGTGGYDAATQSYKMVSSGVAGQVVSVSPSADNIPVAVGDAVTVAFQYQGPGVASPIIQLLDSSGVIVAQATSAPVASVGAFYDYSFTYVVPNDSTIVAARLATVCYETSTTDVHTHYYRKVRFSKADAKGYLDGGMADTVDKDYAWTGTANRSASVLSELADVPLGATSRTYKCTVTDNSGLTASDTVVVSVLPHTRWRKLDGGLVPVRRLIK